MSTSSSSVLVALLCLLFCILPCCGQICNSTNSDDGTTCSYINDLTCRDDHPSEDRECRMDPPLLPDMPDYIQYCNISELYVPSSCASSYIPPPNVSASPIGSINATLFSLNPVMFGANISWDHRFNPTDGYRLEINDAHKEFSNVVCFCIYNPNLTSIELFHDLFQYRFQDFDSKIFVIEVSTIPPLIQNSEDTREWPRTCLDITHTDSSCGLPSYPPPTNITAYYEPSDNQTLYLSWSFDALPLPTIWYIEVYIHDQPPQIFALHNASSEANLIIQMIEAAPYRVRFIPYSHCSGIANNSRFLGCGNAPLVVPTPAPMPTSSILPTLTTTLPTQSSIPTTLPATMKTPQLINEKMNIITGSSVTAGVCTILVLITMVSLIGVCYRMCRRQRPPPPLPPPLRNGHSVFVVYAPQSASERDILKYVVCQLEEYFDVVTSSDASRGDAIKFIEEHERKSDAVLLVCTEEFFLEWEERVTKSHVVAAVQTLLSSAVVQERLDKYAILVLDETSKANHIPSNHYLSNMGVYVLGKERDERVIEDLYRFVTKQIHFQHSRVDRETSTTSVSSSMGSSDLKSRCTESVSIDMNLGSSVDSREYRPIHRFDQFVLEKDTPIPTQAQSLRSGSSPLSGSSGQSNQEHHLLTVLQVPPGLGFDTASLGSHSESL